MMISYDHSIHQTLQPASQPTNYACGGGVAAQPLESRFPGFAVPSELLLPRFGGGTTLGTFGAPVPTALGKSNTKSQTNMQINY